MGSSTAAASKKGGLGAGEGRPSAPRGNSTYDDWRTSPQGLRLARQQDDAEAREAARRADRAAREAERQTEEAQRRAHRV